MHYKSFYNLHRIVNSNIISYQILRDIVLFQNNSATRFTNEKIITYSRGPEVSNVVINNDDSLAIAIKYHGDDASTEGIHVKYGSLEMI